MKKKMLIFVRPDVPSNDVQLIKKIFSQDTFVLNTIPDVVISSTHISFPFLATVVVVLSENGDGSALFCKAETLDRNRVLQAVQSRQAQFKNKRLDGLPHIYFINLDRTPDRRALMETTLPIPHERCQAIDGCCPKVQRLHDTIKSRLTFNIFACALSHIKAISQAYNSQNEMAMIVEDDVSFEHAHHWPTSISNLIKQLPPTWEVLKLIYFDFGVPPKEDELRVERFQLWHKYRWAAAGYIINRKGMKKIIEMKIDQNLSPADHFIFNICETYTVTIPLLTYFVVKSTLTNSSEFEMRDMVEKMWYYFNQERWKNLVKN